MISFCRITSFLIAILVLFFPGCRLFTLSIKGKTIDDQQKYPNTFTTKRDPEMMVFIPAGYFLMGSEEGNEDEKPQHKVYLDAFYIDVAEVTCARYERFLKETGYPPHKLWNPEFDRPEDPVVGVSWYDASAFARWASKRLPTEAEWEKAARGGLVKKRYPWGNKIDKEKANYNSFGITPVKSYEANSFGLYDMAGNVWEWCQDWYNAEYYRISPRKNPRGPMIDSKKVIRGGAWYCNEDALRVSNRHRNDPDLGSFHIGFRCVKSAKDIKLED